MEASSDKVGHIVKAFKSHKILDNKLSFYSLTSDHYRPTSLQYVTPEEQGY